MSGRGKQSLPLPVPRHAPFMQGPLFDVEAEQPAVAYGSAVPVRL